MSYMDLKELNGLKKRVEEGTELHRYSTANYDIDSLARKIHATKSAKLNALRLRKVKQATA